MENLLSIVTLLPAMAALILAGVFARRGCSGAKQCQMDRDDRNQRHLLGVPDHLGAV